MMSAGAYAGIMQRNAFTHGFSLGRMRNEAVELWHRVQKSIKSDQGAAAAKSMREHKVDSSEVDSMDHLRQFNRQYARHRAYLLGLAPVIVLRKGFPLALKARLAAMRRELGGAAPLGKDAVRELATTYSETPRRIRVAWKNGRRTSPRQAPVVAEGAQGGSMPPRGVLRRTARAAAPAYALPSKAALATMKLPRLQGICRDHRINCMKKATKVAVLQQMEWHRAKEEARRAREEAGEGQEGAAAAAGERPAGAAGEAADPINRAFLQAMASGPMAHEACAELRRQRRKLRRTA